ncbi:hypothetical protein GCM10017559_51710 [Streptosporangium longisporum]|uniref:Uncharacterized protein n=1 Tax=Streptosporangium longisporum TaxID=46187 RepID=A0ABP6KVA8_9ACTN
MGYRSTTAPGDAGDTGDTALGGRIPANPSGEAATTQAAPAQAVPIQAVARVREPAWQPKGTASAHRMRRARIGSAIDQGPFGHGSAIIATT